MRAPASISAGKRDAAPTLVKAHGPQADRQRVFRYQNQPCLMITTTDSLAAACERLARHPFVTFDTEFMRETTF